MDLRSSAYQACDLLALWADKTETVFDNYAVEVIRYIVGNDELWKLFLQLLGLPPNERAFALMNDSKFEPIKAAFMAGPLHDKRFAEEKTTAALSMTSTGPVIDAATSPTWVKTVLAAIKALQFILSMIEKT